VISLKFCIIGVGNRWREDDCVGLLIVDKLKAMISREIIDIFYIEEQLFEVQSCFAGYTKIVIIDALPPGSEPGKMKILQVNGSGIILQQRTLQLIRNAYSLHDLDLLWQIQFAFVNGFIGELMLIGIEARTIGYGESLSPQLKKALPALISKVEQRIFDFLEIASVKS
jgi:hydrogenase maturation protease